MLSSEPKKFTKRTFGEISNSRNALFGSFKFTKRTFREISSSRNALFNIIIHIQIYSFRHIYYSYDTEYIYI